MPEPCLGRCAPVTPWSRSEETCHGRKKARTAAVVSAKKCIAAALVTFVVPSTTWGSTSTRRNSRSLNRTHRTGVVAEIWPPRTDGESVRSDGAG